ncbi:MAG: hypothetical protein KDJ20_12140 [Hyphomicrobiales bacterium]|nr:hypothetical protein [Rhodoblastus sp.]MCB9998720.1 hypothetical protein [Methylobacteriaceae bacterium]MCC2104710.1 hypothetical protein [Hyphomicrobiales bacterium]MCC2106614.1 hypothetical protein [Hyphomicrobiales bacterium]MCO5089250.1 hypothetical protein [Methylobacteriaceae bacterium]
MIDVPALARALHVAAIVHWIGGLMFVTMVILPSLGELRPEIRAASFAAIERRFAAQARLSVALAGATGFYLLHAFGLWGALADPHMWRLVAMLALWAVFAIMLFVAEPLFLHDLFDRFAATDPVAAHVLLLRMHRILTVIAIVVIIGTVAGAHGLDF